MRVLWSNIIRISISIWVVGSIVFFAMRILPGSLLEAQLTEAGLSQNQIQVRLVENGYTAPLLEQYSGFWMSFLTGSWGNSIYYAQPISELLAQRLPTTFSLASSSLLISIPLGILWGILAANRLFFSGIIAILISVPVYWTGTLVIFALTGLHINPFALNFILPTIILALHTSAQIAKVVAISLQFEQHADYIRTAYSKGLPTRIVMIRHLMPNIAPLLLQTIVIQAGFLMSGTVVTEMIFLQPGLGTLLVDSVLNRDYPLVQVIVIILSTSYMILLGCVDILVEWIDPRLRVS